MSQPQVQRLWHQLSLHCPFLQSCEHITPVPSHHWLWALIQSILQLVLSPVPTSPSHTSRCAGYSAAWSAMYVIPSPPTSPLPPTANLRTAQQFRAAAETHPHTEGWLVTQHTASAVWQASYSFCLTLNSLNLPLHLQLLPQHAFTSAFCFWSWTLQVFQTRVLFGGVVFLRFPYFSILFTVMPLSTHFSITKQL